MNLYKAENPKGDIFYIVADNYADVEPQLRKFLDKNDWYFYTERCAINIELVAVPNPSSGSYSHKIYFIPPEIKKDE